MSVADKLLQVNQVKQDIKVAIETKGIPMTNVAFTEYANKILDISGGGGEVDEYFYYAKSYFTITNNATLFENAWTNHNKRTTLFDGNISFVVSDSSLGYPLSFYSGSGIDELYDLLASGGARIDEALKITVNNTVYDATSIDSIMNTGLILRYADDQSSQLTLPTPVYVVVDSGNNPFLIVVNATELGMPLGKVIAFIGNENVNYLKIESGFNHYYKNGIIIPDGVEFVPFYSYSGFTAIAVIDEYFENNDFPLTIPNSVTEIGSYAFRDWNSNNQPLVIPNSVTNIGNYAFSYWEANDQPLIIPNSVTEIGDSAFGHWTSNDQPLVIPNSVTSIGQFAFQDWTSNNQPLVIPNSVTSISYQSFYNWTSAKEFIMESETPPTITFSSFTDTNNAPFYVPNDSVEAYKTATNWVDLADRIFPISDRGQ